MARDKRDELILAQAKVIDLMAQLIEERDSVPPAGAKADGAPGKEPACPDPQVPPESSDPHGSPAATNGALSSTAALAIADLEDLASRPKRTNTRKARDAA